MRRFTGPGLRLALLGLAVSLTACSTSAPPPPTSRIPVDERPFVVDPLTGYPATVDRLRADAVRSAFGDFALGASPAAVATKARNMLEVVPDFQPAITLLAQTEFLSGRYRQALTDVAPLIDEHPGYAAAALLAARSHELLGEIDLAYESFRRFADRSAVAAARADALYPRAWEIVENRFDDALSRGRHEEARTHLDQLVAWLPSTDDPAAVGTTPDGEGDPTDEDDPRATDPAIPDEPLSAPAIAVLDAETRLLAALGDRPAELAALTRLSHAEPTVDRLWRLADLELEVGDVRAGLGIFERLAEASPEALGADRALALPDRLAAAQFLWKIELLPPEVRRVSRSAELGRADLAKMLYWLLPGVRFVDLEDAPIAADILDHPSRREILVILDQSLMGMDRTRHRFQPTEPATRQVALAAILSFLQSKTHAGAVPECLAGEPWRPAADRRRPWVCNTAARCGLVADPLDCLPAARLSGREALDLIRHGLETLEAGAGS